MGPLFILLCLAHALNPAAKHNRQKQKRRQQPIRRRTVQPRTTSAYRPPPQPKPRPAPRYQPPPAPTPQPVQAAQTPQRLDIHIYIHQEKPKKERRPRVVEVLPAAPKPLPILPATPRQPYNDDVYQALRSLGFKPTEAKARMAAASLSGSESVEDAVRACLLAKS